MDAAAWIALINTRDAFYNRAWEIMARLQQQKVPLVTTEFVLLEVADALCAPHFRTRTINNINGFRQMPTLQIIPLHPDLLAEGWTLYCQRLDKAWGLSDCISFVVMTQEQITQAFTSDHHYEQAGFVKLLS